jgi:hypothetical protein
MKKFITDLLCALAAAFCPGYFMDKIDTEDTADVYSI